MNPGKLVKNTTTGTYAKIVVSNKPILDVSKPATQPIVANSMLAEYQKTTSEVEHPVNTQVAEEGKNYFGVTFHKI